MTYLPMGAAGDSRRNWQLKAANPSAPWARAELREPSCGAWSGDKSGLRDEKPGLHIRNRQIPARLV